MGTAKSKVEYDKLRYQKDKDQRKEKQKVYDLVNRDKKKGIYLKRTYNLSFDDYQQMLLVQNGCCKICGKHYTTLNRSLDVDHCHRTNKIRGLLCTPCNTGLGHYENKKDLFEIYLKETEWLSPNELLEKENVVTTESTEVASSTPSQSCLPQTD